VGCRKQTPRFWQDAVVPTRVHEPDDADIIARDPRVLLPLYTNRGVGGMPLRFAGRPEVTLFTLKPAN
jgi:predicted MPP superfamily phosphohydrolase